MFLTIGPHTKAPNHLLGTIELTRTEFLAMLAEAALVVRPATKEEKLLRTPWFSPIILSVDGAGRAENNVCGVSEMICFDLDTPGWTLERLQRAFEGLATVFYTTTHSTPSGQRWRGCVFTSRVMTTTEYPRVWRALDAICEGDLDQATKDVCRIMYVPAAWEGACNIFSVQAGVEMDIDAVLSLFPPVASGGASGNLNGGMIMKSNNMTRVRPATVPIITAGMIERYLVTPAGGRFWKMMISAATRFKREGWNLSAQELCDAALEVSRQYSPGVIRTDALREASRALTWADERIPTMTPLERIANKLEWQLRHSKNHSWFARDRT